MKSKPVDRQCSIFSVPLEKLVPANHKLRILADLIDWSGIEKNWDKMFEAADGSPGTGRPATRPRLVASMMLLQDMHGYSDNELLTFWSDVPAFQYFSGEVEFKHKEPIDASTLVKWRQRIEDEGANDLLQLTLAAGLKAGALKKSSFKKVIYDTTAMEKNIAYPKDCELREKGRKALVREARENGLPIRHTYVRKGLKLLHGAQRINPKDKDKKEKYEDIKKSQDAILDKLIKDIRNKSKKIEGFIFSKKLQEVIHTVERLSFPERCEGEKRPYSIHEPDVRCIKKGEGSQNLYFGNKVSVATTHKEGFVVDISVLEGNPHDGHTLKEAIERTVQNTNVKVKEATVDRGYVGHGVTDVIVNMSTDKKDIPKKLRKTLNRRTLVEAMIGHMKNEGRLDICPLLGIEGSKFHAILCGCAHNLRLLINYVKKHIEKFVPIPPPEDQVHA